jgi:hypothetical protein
MRVAMMMAVLIVAASAQTPAVTIKVLEGNGAINNIARRTAYPPVVQVLDSSNQPLAQVPVTFVVPAVGAGGRFGDSGTVLNVVTDSEGKAAARGLVPNNVAGSFEIRVTAAYRGQTARVTITQTNAAPVKASSGNTRKLLVIGLIAGGAAGGLLAATSGGSDSGPAARPPAAEPPRGVVTPGQPGFGPPQ